VNVGGALLRAENLQGDRSVRRSTPPTLLNQALSAILWVTEVRALSKSLKPGNGESLAELHKVQIECNKSKAGPFFARVASQGKPCDPAQKRNHPSRCSVKPSGEEDFYSLKKAGRDISPFRRNGTAVLRSANKRLNPVEPCEKLPAFLKKGQSPSLIQNDPQDEGYR